MGKVHRIKRGFQKIVEQQPWEALRPGEGKSLSLPYSLSVYVGKRYNGTHYISHFGERYKHLMRKLIADFEAGVAHGDKSSVTS